jgi:hypothetical protein
MFRPSWRPSSGCIIKVYTNKNAIMNRSTLVIQPDGGLQEGRNSSC